MIYSRVRIFSKYFEQFTYIDLYVRTELLTQPYAWLWRTGHFPLLHVQILTFHKVTAAALLWLEVSILFQLHTLATTRKALSTGKTNF